MAHIPGAVAPQAEGKYLTALLTTEASCLEPSAWRLPWLCKQGNLDTGDVKQDLSAPPCTPGKGAGRAAEISLSRLASISADQRANNIVLLQFASLHGQVGCVTKPARRELCAGCRESRLLGGGLALTPDGQGAVPAGPAGIPGVAGEVELQVLAAEPAAGTVNSAASYSGVGHSIAPARSPQHAVELWGGRVCVSARVWSSSWPGPTRRVFHF